MPSTRGHEDSLDTALRALSARCSGPDAPTAAEIEDALERGFGQLILLEAKLQRLTRAKDRASQSVIGEPPSSPEQLRDRIAALRYALEDLRGRTTPWHAAPLALGFVFPAER